MDIKEYAKIKAKEWCENQIKMNDKKEHKSGNEFEKEIMNEYPELLEIIMKLKNAYMNKNSYKRFDSWSGDNDPELLEYIGGGYYTNENETFEEYKRQKEEKKL